MKSLFQLVLLPLFACVLLQGCDQPYQILPQQLESHLAVQAEPEAVDSQPTHPTQLACSERGQVELGGECRVLILLQSGQYIAPLDTNALSTILYDGQKVFLDYTPELNGRTRCKDAQPVYVTCLSIDKYDQQRLRNQASTK